jgi:hypothetical protein
MPNRGRKSKRRRAPEVVAAAMGRDGKRSRHLISRSVAVEHEQKLVDDYIANTDPEDLADLVRFANGGGGGRRRLQSLMVSF